MFASFFNRYFYRQQKLEKDRKKHMDHLQQLKDYEEKLTKEKEKRARREQELKRSEVMRG